MIRRDLLSQTVRVTFVSVLFVLVLSACSTNPVTGQRELFIVSPTQELSIGEREYLPNQQSQGGIYRTDPALGAYVRQVGQRLAAVADSPLPYEFVVLNNSTPNAWALPGGKIAINRGLLLQLRNEAELAAVLGHEIVHAAARHYARTLSRASALELGANILIDLAIEEEWRDTDLLQQGKQTALFAFNQRYSREAEIQSDEYGIRYMVRAGYDPSAAVTLQSTFVDMARQSDGSFDALFASHPPSLERYERNQQTITQYPSGGRLGEQAYLDATARLRETAPAYFLMQRALQYAAVDEHQKSMDTIREAISAVPGEARFHGTLGTILYNQRDHEGAIAAYSHAITLDSGYYEYFLGRGLAYANLQRFSSAEADLTRSQELLPTQHAMDALQAIKER
ncbi:MAG: M48 family metalloprotease [Pseudomonadota bacterium]